MALNHIIVDSTATDSQDAADSILSEDAGGTTTTNAGAFANTGDFAVATDKFTVASATGNTVVAGTCDIAGATDVTGDLTVNTDKVTITAASGNTDIAGTLTADGLSNLDGGIAVDTDKFTVSAAGAVVAASTLTAAGNTTLSGTCDIAGDFAVNTDKFAVTATSGNTSVAGTLGVTGNTTMSGTCAIAGDLTLSAGVSLAEGFTANTTEVDASTYDLLATDYTLLVAYSATGACTITLPTAQAVDGREIHVIDSGGDASTSNITVDTEGSETISGAATAVIDADYGSLSFISDGTNWFTK